jgi:tRNA A37 threonylcarbamoyladenosine dehydratase
MSRIGLEKSFLAEAFVRAEQALGVKAVSALAAAKVAVIGVGGVGGWCAEALVRSGVGSIFIADPDRIVPSNINRQIMATSKTIGEYKVDSLKRRLLEINPALAIDASIERYSEETAEQFALDKFDCVVDAIDSLDDKADLIVHVTSLNRPTLFSSMGAAMRRDAFSIAKDEFWNIKGDALARSLRSKFRKSGVFPKRKFKCVYSRECPSKPNDAPVTSEKRAYGSLVHVSAIFGLMLAGMVIDDITSIDAVN